MKKITLFLVLFSSWNVLIAQQIKSVQLRSLQTENYSAIVPLGTILELSFDDLDGDSKDYQYKIEHMTIDWKSSDLSTGQYIDGFDQNTIFEVSNSFNTLQNYTHYSVRFPNENTIITKSGNYLLSILNDDDKLVFTRRFVLYEKKTTVGVSVVRSRNTKTLNQQQTVQFSVNHPEMQINNPNQEIKVVVLKNNNWNDKISGLQPQYIKGNQLLYKSTTKTNFWGGNEYLNFDTKYLRNKSFNIVRVEKRDIFHHFLYPFEVNPFRKYTYNPDINGQFVFRTLEANDVQTEADYAMMHFSLFTNQALKNKDIYVYGAFNDFELSDENKMTFDENQGDYFAEIPFKQGFYNYTYVTKDKNENVDLNELNGSFYQTENEYTVIVYYKPFGGFYEQVIGVGSGFFNQNR